MKYVLLAGALAGLTVLGIASRREGASAPIVTAIAQPTTLEGCLGRGTKPGEFALAAGGRDYLVMPGIGVDLADHVRHQVQLTGSVERGSRGLVLRVSAVRVVESMCTPA